MPRNIAAEWETNDHVTEKVLVYPLHSVGALVMVVPVVLDMQAQGLTKNPHLPSSCRDGRFQVFPEATSSPPNDRKGTPRRVLWPFYRTPTAGQSCAFERRTMALIYGVSLERALPLALCSVDHGLSSPSRSTVSHISRLCSRRPPPNPSVVGNGGWFEGKNFQLRAWTKSRSRPAGGRKNNFIGDSALLKVISRLSPYTTLS